MPVFTSWPTIPRNALDRVVDIIRQDQSGGVALVGSEGVGKTTLARMAAERLGLGDPVWVVGTLAQSMVPFGAFSPLLDVHEAGKPAELMAAAAESVLRQANSAPIIVDNARLLDPLSASLVYRLAKEEKARPAGSPVIVTVRSVLRVPRVVSALWDDGLLDRVEVDVMDSSEIAALVEAAGGGDAAALYRHCAGNPLHLRMLMTTGGSEETLDGAIDHYLSALTPAVRRVLGHLCVFEPLSREDLVAVTDEAAVQAALDLGAVTLRGPLAYSGHALFLERLAAGLDRTDIQRFRTEIAAQLTKTPTRTTADRLGRTLIAVQGEGPVDAGAVIAAAQEALLLGDVGLAERLARGALERHDNFDARLALSTALGFQGRGREADAVLADVDMETMSEDQLMAWALPRAANQFWMLSEPERAAIFLQNVRQRLGENPSRLTLDALSGTFAMNAGNIRKAKETAEEVLSHQDAPDMAVAWAASADALCAARMGRFDEVDPAVQRALSVEYPGILRFTLGLAETSTLIMAGKLDEAEEAARRYTDFAETTQPGRAIGEVLLAQVLLARGDAAAAAVLLRPASATLARTGYSWGPLSLTYLTTALGYLDDIPESAKALARAQSRHGTKSAMFAPELGVARAWRLATIGDRPAALTAAREAARTAKRSGQLAVAIRSWHEAVRLGDRRAADSMSVIADSVPCAYTDMAMAHARALQAGDAAALTAVAEQLAAAGFKGAAADAARQAQELAG